MKTSIVCILSLFSLISQSVLAAPPPSSPGSVARGSAPESYLLSPRDLVSFSVLNEPETAAEQRIDGDGRIRLPYIGTMNIAGMTVRDAEARLERAYIDSDIYITPQITVRVLEYSISEVSVLGQVNDPGNITFPIEANGLDIREVISQAGGFTNIARSKEVIVTRQTARNKETFKVNVDEMLKRKNEKIDAFLVQAGDVIFVPERFF